MDAGGEATRDASVLEEPTSDGDSRRFVPVAAAFSSLDKAIKGMQLYQGQGSLVERLLTDLEQKAAVALADGDITVKVASVGWVFEGKALLSDDRRRFYLFRLFCDGVREFSIREGIDREELRGLLEVLMCSPKEGEDDLVTLLWQKELKHVDCYVVDVFMAGAQVDETGDLTLTEKSAKSKLNPMADDGESEVVLSPDDIRLLKVEEHLSWLGEARAVRALSGQHLELLEGIQEAFKMPTDYDRFVAIALEAAEKEREGGESRGASPLVLGVYDSLLEKEESEPLLRILRFLAARKEPITSVCRELRDAILEPARMEKLTPVVEKEPEVFLEALTPFGKTNEDGLLALLTSLPRGEIQEKLQTILLEQGIALTPFYRQQLQSEEEATVLGAMESLGQIGTTEALEGVVEMLPSTRSDIRTAALQALGGRYFESARAALGRLLRDPSADNRRMAIELLSGANDQKATWLLLATAQDSSSYSRSPEEVRLLFDALTRSDDERVLKYFETLLEEKNFTRSKQIVERQVIAATALGRANNRESTEVLEKARGRWFLPKKVKQAIASSLARGKARK